MDRGKVLIFGLLIALSFSCSKKEADRDRFFLLGNKALSEREYAQAIHNYSEAIKIDDQFAEAFNNRGIAYYEGNDPVFALQDYNQAIYLKTDYTDARYNRSNAYSQLKRFDDAISDLNIVKETYGDSSYVQFALGLAHHKFGQQDSAKMYFNRALELDPDNAEIFINLGVVYFHTNSLDSAFNYANQGILNDPEEILGYNLLGMISMKRQEWAKSIRYFERGLKLEIYHPVLLNNRGYAYMMVDSMELAKEDIDQSILRDTDNLWAYRNKGIWHYKQQDYEAAIRLLSRALDKKEYVENVHSYLGLTYLALDQKAEACKMFKKAESFGEDMSKPYLKNCE